MTSISRCCHVTIKRVYQCFHKCWWLIPQERMWRLRREVCQKILNISRLFHTDLWHYKMSVLRSHFKCMMRHGYWLEPRSRLLLNIIGYIYQVFLQEVLWKINTILLKPKVVKKKQQKNNSLLNPSSEKTFYNHDLATVSRQCTLWSTFGVF